MITLASSEFVWMLSDGFQLFLKVKHFIVETIQPILAFLYYKEINIEFRSVLFTFSPRFLLLYTFALQYADKDGG